MLHHGSVSMIILTIVTSFVLSLYSCKNSTEPDEVPPSDIYIVAPAEGSTVSEIVTIRAVANDDRGLAMINFWIDGILAEDSDDAEEPYAYNWNTSSFENGSKHVLTVRAFDTSGNKRDSQPITVTVDNSNAVPTLVELNSIQYADGSFLISWPPSRDEDFDSYVLSESMSEDMQGEIVIFTSTERLDTTTTVAGLLFSEKRFYRLAVRDTVGLVTLSSVRTGNAVQPKTFTFQPGREDGKDAEVWNLPCNSSYAQQSGLCEKVNEGQAPYFRAASWTYQGTLATHRGYIRFDLGTIDVECRIDSAHLFLFSQTSSGQTQSGENGFQLSRVSEVWEENTILWKNQPGVVTLNEGEDFLVVSRSTDPNEDYKLDITQMVVYWSENPQNNFGLRLSLMNENPYRRVFFASSEYSDTIRRPKLVVYASCK